MLRTVVRDSHRLLGATLAIAVPVPEELAEKEREIVHRLSVQLRGRSRPGPTRARVRFIVLAQRIGTARAPVELS